MNSTSKPFLTTTISYCTNDYRFLRKCVEEARIFSEQILIVVCDHFFDGEKENRALLEKCYQEFPDCTFIEFEFLKDELYSPYLLRSSKDPDWKSCWHSTPRYISFFYLDARCEQVLFLDVDEIFEGERFLNWLKNGCYQDHTAMRLQAYYYFREARFRATQRHNLSLWSLRKVLEPHMLMSSDDRWGIFGAIPGKKKEFVLGEGDLPMVHHYSGVKTKEEWIKKSASWGHSWEKNWLELIEENYRSDFAGKDFTHGHNYEIVDPYFDPFQVKVEALSATEKNVSNVIRVNKNTIQRKELSYSFGI